eukprot:TRINITY_DN2143_c0_g1_i4.p1 TRINITY_DN2143_c0_g1~~TRINITY_DN2143_c0_g1_i4.p1  ORF type:complete len:468 (+),score=13.44 TRINITY_DN2143_c0_g1_i4:107-1510(+)
MLFQRKNQRKVQSHKQKRTIRICLPWPCPTSKSDQLENIPLLPVLLIPGEFGTVLNVRQAGTKEDGERAWVKIDRADCQMKKLWGQFSDKSGRVECLDQNLEVYIPEAQDGGLFPLETLDPSWPNNIQILQCFSAMIQSFKNQGYIPGKTLFGYGYDFRQSCRYHSMEVIERLRNISEINGGRRVNVITHSIGGLLLQALLADHSTQFEKYINKWITIATPFGGAPGFAMDSLVSGRQFVRGWESHFFVQQNTFTQLCSQCPSMYEICHYDSQEQDNVLEQSDIIQEVKYNTSPQAILWMKSDMDMGVKQECYSIQYFDQLQEKVFADNKITINKREKNVPINRSCWSFAREFWQIRQKARIPSTCQFYNLYGIGFNTPYSVVYGCPSDPIHSYKDLRCENNSTFIGVDGDGVVPAKCAYQDGLDACERVGIQGLHKNILSSTRAIQQIFKWLHADNLIDQDWVMVL